MTWSFRPRPLVATADGRYVSPAGRAYLVSVEPRMGVPDAVEVMLDGSPTIPGTPVPSLVLFVNAEPRTVEKTIGWLLREADRLEEKWAKLQSAFPHEVPEAAPLPVLPTLDEAMEAYERAMDGQEEEPETGAEK